MGKQQSRGTDPTLHGDGENSEKVNTGRFGIGFGFHFTFLFLYFGGQSCCLSQLRLLSLLVVFTFGLLVPGSASSLLLSSQADQYLRPFLFLLKVKAGSETNLTAFLTRSF